MYVKCFGPASVGLFAFWAVGIGAGGIEGDRVGAIVAFDEG